MTGYIFLRGVRSSQATESASVLVNILCLVKCGVYIQWIVVQSKKNKTMLPAEKLMGLRSLR